VALGEAAVVGVADSWGLTEGVGPAQAAATRSVPSTAPIETPRVTTSESRRRPIVQRYAALAVTDPFRRRGTSARAGSVLADARRIVAAWLEVDGESFDIERA
jgi:hypothetical protein